MKTIAKVTVGENVTEINVLPAAVTAYEEEHDQTIAEAIASDRTRWFPWLVWWTLQKRHGEARDFMDWYASIDDIEDVTPKQKEGTANPSGAGRAPASAKSRK